MSFYDFVVSGWDPCVNVVLLEDCAAVLGTGGSLQCRYRNVQNGTYQCCGSGFDP
jgi:hypothetical protein